MSHSRAASRLAAASVAATLSLRNPRILAIRSSRPSPAARWRSGPFMSRSRRSPGIWPTGTGSRTTIPARSTSNCSPRTSPSPSGLAASIRSTPMPGFRRMRSAASSPKNGNWKQNPLRLEINLRKGVMFPDKPGVMAARELVADDVVFSFNHRDKSPKKIASYFDHIDKVEATDKHTVLFTFKNYNAEWDYRFGWGYYSGIIPKEVADAGAGNWKNVNGTGPFHACRFRAGQLEHLCQESELLGHGEDQRRRDQAAAGRQGRLPHDQGRGDLPHGVAHRQTRHSRKHQMVRGR